MDAFNYSFFNWHMNPIICIKNVLWEEGCGREFVACVVINLVGFKEEGCGRGFWRLLFCRSSPGRASLFILSRSKILFIKLIFSFNGWFPLALNLSSYSVATFFVLWDALSWYRVVCRVMRSVLCCYLWALLLQQGAIDVVGALFYSYKFFLSTLSCIILQ